MSLKKRMFRSNMMILCCAMVLLLLIIMAVLIFLKIPCGHLEEDIDYHGEKEFEHVCQTFNAMQHTIRADREQRISNERARIDMVTGISHDLRTPLTSIQG
ncbi:MAG TPA: hypothetical protein IAB53_01130 [Candidatus Scybalocola faecipullorum]|nr:hypothetical protein [Candidatus Scybalocola faecipullorum]